MGTDEMVPLKIRWYLNFRNFSNFIRIIQVLLCDVRDVLFQLDPFESLSVEQGLGVAVSAQDKRQLFFGQLR